jgi:putative glutamine amidotransferase
MPQDRSSRRPRIGITVDYNDALTQYGSPYAYAAAVEKAGGLPFLLPYRVDLSLIPEYVDSLDGMLFSGGNDLDPAAWGEHRHEKTVPIDPLRERFERALIAEVEKRRKPTLGICLGSQLMNVHRGGTLNQFIPELDRVDKSIEHRRLDGTWDARHDVIVQPDAIIAKAMGTTTVRSNTSHKQSIRDVGKGLRIIATSPDGIVEGIEDVTMPLWIGVQWHPERQHDEKEHLALFKLLVEKAAEK